MSIVDDVEASLLLKSPDVASDIDVVQHLYDTFTWRFIHAGCFLLGGTTFLAGTLVLLSSSSVAPLISALFYIIGSCGFLCVDVLEFFTFTGAALLSLNISASAIGSTAYVIGSIGFLPIVLNGIWGTSIGVWGFIIGSALIAVSQMMKVLRLLLINNHRDINAIGVEANAGLGAACFLIGTAALNSWSFMSVILVWAAGSIFFTIGGCFLAYRHFYLLIT